MHHIYLTDIYRIFYSTAADSIFFSSVHGTLSEIDHVLDYKMTLNKFTRYNNILYLYWSKLNETENQQ
jgi:hypothetical protein